MEYQGVAIVNSPDKTTKIVVVNVEKIAGAIVIEDGTKEEQIKKLIQTSIIESLNTCLESLVNQETEDPSVYVNLRYLLPGIVSMDVNHF